LNLQEEKKFYNYSLAQEDQGVFLELIVA